MYRYDVRMIQPRQHPCFGQVDFRFRIGKRPTQSRHLDGDQSMQFRIERQIDCPKGPLAKGFANLIAPYPFGRSCTDDVEFLRACGNYIMRGCGNVE